MIRQAEIKDAARIKKIHTASVRALCAPFYTPDQIKTWTAGTPDGMRRVIEQSPYFIVMETNKTITGFASLRPDFSIWHLYIDPACVQKGIGTALLKNMEEFLLKAGHKTITLDSTLSAAEFYRRNGYEDIGKSHVHMADQKIEVIKMKKML